MNKRERMTLRALKLVEAFPPDVPPIVLSSGDSSKGAYKVRFCRLCGAMVLESMTTAHVLTVAHDEF